MKSRIGKCIIFICIKIMTFVPKKLYRLERFSLFCGFYLQLYMVIPSDASSN